MIEIDGLIHDTRDQAEHDECRNAFMRELGLEVIRIAAADVIRDADAVAQSLIDLCTGAAGPSTTQQS